MRMCNHGAGWLVDEVGAVAYFFHPGTWAPLSCKTASLDILWADLPFLSKLNRIRDFSAMPAQLAGRYGGQVVWWVQQFLDASVS
jgi:hypothetical protein